MTERQSEIYEDIIKRRGEENPLTKSQKKHLKKVAKKREKSEIRREKQELHKKTSKKVIRDNRGIKDYTPEFTKEASERYIEDLKKVISEGIPDRILWYVISYKKRYLELLLKWSGPKNHIYYFLKGLLESYWDNGEVQSYIEKEKSNLECS